MENIIVLILAGGDSSRMWPLKDKHCLNFFSKPLIYYSVNQLKRFKFNNIVIVANKNNAAVFDELKKEFSDVKIRIIQQTDPRGMAGAVLSAKSIISKNSILVIGPSDIYEDVIFANFNQILNKRPQAVISGTSVDEYFPGGYLKVEKGEVIELQEKPGKGRKISDIVTFVFDYFENADLLLEAILKVESKKDNIFEEAIMQLIKKGVHFQFLKYNGFWGYLKYPWHILNCLEYFLSKINIKKILSSTIDKSASISGNVYIGEGVRILENAKIVGPAYIGRGTIVGNNSIIRESIIGTNCVVGFSTEITRSYIGNNCWFHTNYIGDSVIDNNVGMGAGAILANFRLDEADIKSKIGKKFESTGRIKLGAIIGENVRIGVNSSIMPGIKIGKNSIIGPGLILQQDIEDNKICFLDKIKYSVKNNENLISSTSRVKIKKSIKFK